MKTLCTEVDGLSVPSQFWAQAQKVKENLRHLSLKIKQFVVDGKASLNFAINASKDRDIFAWMTGVNGSLTIIKNQVC